LNQPFCIQHKIVTHGKESRKNNQNDNLFTVTLNGYHLFPMDEKISIHKKKDNPPFGTAIIHQQAHQNGKTLLLYELLSISTVN
jgi:hypothetical protein